MRSASCGDAAAHFANVRFGFGSRASLAVCDSALPLRAAVPKRCVPTAAGCAAVTAGNLRSTVVAFRWCAAIIARRFLLRCCGALSAIECSGRPRVCPLGMQRGTQHATAVASEWVAQAHAPGGVRVAHRRALQALGAAAAASGCAAVCAQAAPQRARTFQRMAPVRCR